MVPETHSKWCTSSLICPLNELQGLASMPIHDCPHSFAELASTVLPEHMTRMRRALVSPQPMADFAKPRMGVRTLLKARGLEEDFSGCYVLVDDGKPIYVGISRGVFSRLRQHVFGKTHFDASLCFRIAMAKHPDRTITQLTREKAMLDTQFGVSFTEAQNYLTSVQVAFIEVKNPLELYIFEAYCAVELDTHQWNSFETH